MLRFIFFILNAICSQSTLICKPIVSSYIISFRFGQCSLKDHIETIRKVEFKRLEEEGDEFNAQVRSMFLSDNKKTLNIVIDNLFGNKESLTVVYRVSFFTVSDRKIFEGYFNIEKKENNSFSVYSAVSRNDVDLLNYAYHKYLSEIFQEYKNFSIIPNSTILYQKDFVKENKPSLTYYFINHRGLKEALDSLNECLSEVNHEEDIPGKINKFFDGRREHIVGLQKKYSDSKQLYDFCAGIDCELSNLLMDILLLIEMETRRFLNDSILPEFNEKNIYSAVKEIKVFDIPKTTYKKKDYEIKIKLLPKGNTDLYNEREIWLKKNKDKNNYTVFVSKDLCKLCRESNWKIEVLDTKDKSKSMILEL